MAPTLRSLCALSLAFFCKFCYRWLPSELNPADRGSRLYTSLKPPSSDDTSHDGHHLSKAITKRTAYPRNNLSHCANSSNLDSPIANQSIRGSLQPHFSHCSSRSRQDASTSCQPVFVDSHQLTSTFGIGPRRLPPLLTSVPVTVKLADAYSRLGKPNPIQAAVSDLALPTSTTFSAASLSPSDDHAVSKPLHRRINPRQSLDINCIADQFNKDVKKFA